MPTPGEYKTVQARILEYTEATRFDRSLDLANKKNRGSFDELGFSSN